MLRLAAMKRELKVKELNLIDSARRRFLKHQQDQRRIQLKRLDDEIQRKVICFVLVCCHFTFDYVTQTIILHFGSKDFF